MPAAGASSTSGNGAANIEKKLDVVTDRVNDMNVSTTKQLERQSAVLEELSRTLRDIAERLRALENETKANIATMGTRLDAAFRRIDETRQDLEVAKSARQRDIDDLHARACATDDRIPEKLRERLEAIEKVTPGLLQTNRILAIVAGLLLTSVFGLLWALLTGQIAIQQIIK